MTLLPRMCAAALLSLTSVAAQAQVQPKREVKAVRFYDGPVRVQRIAGTIDLGATGTPPRLSMMLRNDSASSQALATAFRGAAPAQLTVAPRDTSAATVPIAVERSGSPTGAQSVLFDLSPLLAGLPPEHPPDEVDIRFILPAGVPALIRSNAELQRESGGGRVSYRLVRKGAYLTPVNLTYTTQPVTLELEKQVQPAAIVRPGPVTVSLTIRNSGSALAHGVLLEDNFDPRDFAGTGPEFRLVSGGVNDRRLVWSRTLPDLGPGSGTTITYVVQARMPVHSISLNPVKATMAGQLVGASNKVRLDSLSKQSGRR